jgi:hypothetical protein
MSNIVGLNGEVLKQVLVDKEVLKGNKKISKEDGVKAEQDLKARQEEVNNRPLLTSEDMKVTPAGSRLICRGYIKPKKEGRIILAGENENKIVPCLEVMKIGPNVKTIIEGQWVRINDNCTPQMIPYKGEVFYFFQEHDIAFVYDEQPDMDDVLGSATMIVRDLTEYVVVDKMKKLKAKITTEA